MNRGFSLVELIIATMIFTLIIGAAFALFDSSRKVSEQGEFKAQMLQEARRAMRSLRADLQGAYSSTSAYDTGLIGTQSGGENEPLYTLDLVSANNAVPLTVFSTSLAPAAIGSNPYGEIDLARTNYSINANTSSTKKGLVRLKTKQLLQTTVVQTNDDNLDEIAPHAVYVKFRYYDGTLSNWADTWDSTVSKYLPKAIEVTLYLKDTFKNQDVTEKYVEKFYLPFAAEAPKKQ